jgi:DNA-directed RNA polymerase subunit beta'
MGKKQLGDLIDAATASGQKETVLLADRLRTLGYTYATKAGISICIDDMVIPARRRSCSRRRRRTSSEIEEQYTEGPHHRRRALQQGRRHLGAGRRADRRRDDEGDRQGESVTRRDRREAAQPVVQPDLHHGRLRRARLAAADPQLAGMRGLMAKPSGEIIETPITANFREGLSVLQYFISTHGARKGLADTALKTANSGYLTRRLVDVAQDCIITEYDCGTIDGIEMTPLVEGGEVIERSATASSAAWRSRTSSIRTPARCWSRERPRSRGQGPIIEDAGIEKVKIRSVLTCETGAASASKCYGRDLARGTWSTSARRSASSPRSRSASPARSSRCAPSTSAASAGPHRAVAARGAQRRRHQAGERPDVVQAREGRHVVMNRHGEVVIGRDRPRARALRLTYGAKLQGEGRRDRSRPGSCSPSGIRSRCRSSPRSAGVVKFGDVIEGVTMESSSTRSPACRARDHRVEGRGQRPAHLAQGRRRQARPRSSRNSELDARYFLPVGANIAARRRLVEAGDVIAKIPRETTKTKDITGGLPRVAELFEARKPKEHAVISEIDGVVSFGKDTKGKRKVVITPEVGDPQGVPDPKGKHLSVREGDRVVRGRAADGRRGEPARHPRCSARRRWPSTWSTRSRRSTGSRA